MSGPRWLVSLGVAGGRWWLAGGRAKPVSAVFGHPAVMKGFRPRNDSATFFQQAAEQSVTRFSKRKATVMDGWTTAA